MPSTIRSARHLRLADMLRTARKAAGLQQVEVAKRLGRHQPFIVNIEQAQRRIDVIEFLQLARILDLDPHEAIDVLLGIDEDG